MDIKDYEILFDQFCHIFCRSIKIDIMKIKYKQWWSRIPPISTNQTTTSYLKPLNTTKTMTYGIGNLGPCFQAASRRKSKDCLVQNEDNVSGWRDMFTSRLLFQWATTIKIQLSVLVWFKVDIIIISLNLTCFHHDIG